MAAGQIEEIQIRLRLITKKFSKGLGRAQVQLKRVSKNIQGFGMVMKKPVQELKNMDGRMKGMNTTGGKFAFGMRKMTHGMRGFRMEMLGVMFFGMAMMRMFSQLTGTSMEWYGVTEILTPALGLLFMPIGEFMSGAALKFLEWVQALTPAQKKWINIIVAVVGAIGLFLAVIGTLALGIGSIILVFGSFGAFIAMAGTVLLVLVGIFLIVKGVIDIVKGKLEGIGLVIMGIGAILLLFIGWWALLIIAAGAAVFWIIKNWDKVKEFLSSVFSAIGGFFKNMWEVGKKWVSKIVDFIMDKFGKVKDFITGIFGGGGGSSSGTSTKRGKQDFIWRSGQGATSISPHDTVVGFKGDSPDFGGGRGGESNITNNFYGFTKEDLMRELDDRDRKLVNQLERNI